MSGGAASSLLRLPLLLLLSGSAAFTVSMSLNAPQNRAVQNESKDRKTDGTDSIITSVTGADRQRRPLLEKTRPFVLVDGHRQNLAEAFQSGGYNDTLQCGLEVRGQLFLLDLQKNHDLLPEPPNVFYYLPNGTGVSVKAGPETHCYYHGSVRGFPESRAALSTCAGLRGVVVINSTLSFELQPEEEEDRRDGAGAGAGEGVHLLFSPTPLEGDSAKGCGVPNTAPAGEDAGVHNFTHRRRRDILSETKFIELVLVADHQEFINYQKNNKTIMYRMLDVANQVDWFYRPLNVRVALIGLEIWSDKDKIQVEKSPTETLSNFLEWRTRELLPRLRHDNAQLIMGGAFDGTTVGMASQGSMCSKDRSGGVNVDHLVSILGVASTVAHELGHNLGMSHDTAERHCSCQNEPRLGGCIMEPSTGLMPGQQFSSCSSSDLSVSLLHGGGMCLFNVPKPEVLMGGARCGNLYVEMGEECDCGLLQECDDPCCNASTCQLMPGAQCSSDGVCCQDCKLRAAGSVCREPLGECDLPEFCTGSSSYCPPNVFLQNGEPCEDGATFCYGGVCASMAAQCQLLWGPNSTSAPTICFSSVNKRGNKFGNCGQLTNGSYVPCENTDVRCGRIQCQGGRERPLLGTSAEILTTTVHFNHSDLVCRGTFFHLGDDVSDPATVASGTSCGLGKVCLDQKCQDVSVLGVDDCRRKCNGHGVCNSNKNCHCDMGWAPPDCRYSGHGGSVDSGPATSTPESDPVRVALLVVFLFILPLVLLVLFLRIPRVRRLVMCLGANSPLHKARQNNRTPVRERDNNSNGEQVRPLRYHLNPQPDIPMTPAQKEVHHRPAPPTKPLPPHPDSTPTSAPQGVKQRAAPPSKPLPPDPLCWQVQRLVTRPAAPNKPLPPDPVTPVKLPVSLKPLVPRKPSPLTVPPHAMSSPPPHSSSCSTKPNVATATAAPNRRLPAPPTRPLNSHKVESYFPL